MAKVKKHAKGGSYWITVPDPSPAKKPQKPSPNLEGWNIPSLKPNK